MEDSELDEFWWTAAAATTEPDARKSDAESAGCSLLHPTVNTARIHGKSFLAFMFKGTPDPAYCIPAG